MYDKQQAVNEKRLRVRTSPGTDGWSCLIRLEISFYRCSDW